MLGALAGAALSCASLRVRNTPWRFGQCFCSAHVEFLHASRTGACWYARECRGPHKSISAGEAAAQSTYSARQRAFETRSGSTHRRFRGRHGISPTSWDGIRALFGRAASNRPRSARPDAQSPHDAVEQNNPHLREHLTDGVDRRRHLAQHLQHARRRVPPLQRVLELPEIEDDVPQIVGRRLLSWSTS